MTQEFKTNAGNKSNLGWSDMSGMFLGARFSKIIVVRTP